MLGFIANVGSHACSLFYVPCRVCSARTTSGSGRADAAAGASCVAAATTAKPTLISSWFWSNTTDIWYAFRQVKFLCILTAKRVDNSYLAIFLLFWDINRCNWKNVQDWTLNPERFFFTYNFIFFIRDFSMFPKKKNVLCAFIWRLSDRSGLYFTRSEREP